jgi:hypothetical protein
MSGLGAVPGRERPIIDGAHGLLEPWAHVIGLIDSGADKTAFFLPSTRC